MDFMTSIKTVLGKYADFSGRARRSEYWWWALAAFVIEIALQVISKPLYYVFVLGVFVPSIAVGARRMHDIGKSGWFLLIPIYNIVLLATDTTPGENSYGPNSKAIGGLDLPSDGFGTPPPGH
jgi:uncharacterized membrane protein YhaH (DUF805 family)